MKTKRQTAMEKKENTARVALGFDCMLLGLKINWKQMKKHAFNRQVSWIKLLVYIYQYIFIYMLASISLHICAVLLSVSVCVEFRFFFFFSGNISGTTPISMLCLCFSVASSSFFFRLLPLLLRLLLLLEIFFGDKERVKQKMMKNSIEKNNNRCM